MENTNPQDVLNGNLDGFIKVALAQRVYGKDKTIIS